MSAAVRPAAGAAAVALVGGALLLAPAALPLRAPLLLFFLLAAPAAVLFTGLPGLDALSRTVVALLGSVTANLLLAQLLLVGDHWSAEAGVAVVTAAGSAALLGLAVPTAWAGPAGPAEHGIPRRGRR
ncbi:hypothetical protein QNO07_20105 [Streptomyces sp. 549]|uniref:hypothetical protein n=1 Tax=Streptomyces sp. 549 TaxID=3049076 RepID=UPI0024C45255|nr:hypothetical protein [Streptomyces sp. 549]MDK1475692.1 hypothetical protein [Streptomyces sp. 549]